VIRHRYPEPIAERWVRENGVEVLRSPVRLLAQDWDYCKSPLKTSWRRSPSLLLEICTNNTRVHEPAPSGGPYSPLDDLLRKAAPGESRAMCLGCPRGLAGRSAPPGASPARLCGLADFEQRHPTRTLVTGRDPRLILDGKPRAPAGAPPSHRIHCTETSIQTPALSSFWGGPQQAVVPPSHRLGPARYACSTCIEESLALLRTGCARAPFFASGADRNTPSARRSRPDSTTTEFRSCATPWGASIRRAPSLATTHITPPLQRQRHQPSPVSPPWLLPCALLSLPLRARFYRAPFTCASGELQ
jgi:hypothetical protein